MRLAAILIFTATLLFFFANSACAENDITTAQASVFVDRDGDGFNDAATDQDTDGIPDELNLQSPSSPDSSALTEFTFTTAMLAGSRYPMFLHNSAAFDYLKSQLVGLSQHRGAFSAGADFGPGSDIGSGAVLGGGCIGGVCTPK